MDFNSTRTYRNLCRAFDEKCKSAAVYMLCRQKAREDGLEQVGDIFSQSARNELEHARAFVHLLDNTGLPYTSDSLLTSRRRESARRQMYRRFARIAAAEHLRKISAALDRIAAIDEKHGERFHILYDNMDTARIFCRDTKKRWICARCGYETDALCCFEQCPVCGAPQGFGRIKAENY